MKKSIKDSQINYLINTVKNNYISDVEIDNRKLSVTKNGSTSTVDLGYPDASESNAGLLTSTDFTKLKKIPENAEANQNAFAAIKFNEMAVMADTATDIMHITSGDNISFDVDESGESIVIKAENTTYENATPTEAGLMAPEDKIKLDSLSNNIYTQNDEPTDAPIGSLWVDMDSIGGAGGSVELDGSLTKEGMAADAKAVGDTLQKYALKNELGEFLPKVTTANNGQFLRVLNGVWTVSSIANAEEASF